MQRVQGEEAGRCAQGSGAQLRTETPLQCALDSTAAQLWWLGDASWTQLTELVSKQAGY